MRPSHKWLFGLALFALMGAVASVARADVDLTGDWIVEYDGNGMLPDSTETATLVQSGTSLAFDDMTGTIDPATGVFHVEGEPTSDTWACSGRRRRTTVRRRRTATTSRVR
jgi:hypothetical protein